MWMVAPGIEGTETV